MPREPALLTSAATDGGAAGSMERAHARRAGANVRRRSVGSPDQRTVRGSSVSRITPG